MPPGAEATTATHFLDTLPFDWTRPEAGTLLQILVRAYRESTNAIALAELAGVACAHVPNGSTHALHWRNILTAARDQGVLRELVERALADRAIRAYHVELQRLVEHTPPESDGAATVREVLLTPASADPVATVHTLRPGDVVGERYHLAAQLEGGTFGEVWKARMGRLHDRPVTIKVLKLDALGESERRRFDVEIGALATLPHHPNVVGVLDRGDHAGRPFVVLEYLHGATMARWLAAECQGGRRPDGGTVRTLFRGVLSGVAEAHLIEAPTGPVVHRDLTPANVMVVETAAGERLPKVVDFGLARRGAGIGTAQHTILGTPPYMAPEQWLLAATPIGPWTDVFALGVILTELLVGRRTFPGSPADWWGRAQDTVARRNLSASVLMQADWWGVAVAHAHALDAEEDVRAVLAGLRGDLPPGVWAVIAKALRFEGRERWADARQMRDALDAAWATPPPARTPVVSRGWQGQALPVGMRRGAVQGEYIWDVGLGREIPMVWVPPGRFVMGSPKGEAGRFDDEGPPHAVELREGFWLGATPVTQALWEAVMGANPSRFKSPDRPVENVSWKDCQAFLAKLNAEVPGLEARLPREAEWEYACRGGTTTATWRGDLVIVGEYNAPTLDPIAWYGGNSGEDFELTDAWDSSGWAKKQYPHTRAGTRSVRGRQPNPLGLYDMLGNVWERCEDWYGPYEAAAAVDPCGPPTGSLRVLRGGSWRDHARDVRAARRLANAPDYREARVGFRLARGQAAPGPERASIVTPLDSPVIVPPRRSVGMARATVAGEYIWDEGRGREIPMVWVPPGHFVMGSPEGEAGRFENEGPQHAVELREGFWLGVTPVTQAQWEAVMGANPSRFKSRDRPVESVSWDDCQAFITKLNREVPGLEARLPREAEWEYACRGGTTTATWRGDLTVVGRCNAPLLDSIAWYAGNSGVGYELREGEDSRMWPEKQYPHTCAGTRPVRGKQPNLLGLYDMLGNVYEWCEDWHGPYESAAVVNPCGPAAGSDHVIRGGSWYGYAGFVRAAHRSVVALVIPFGHVGFRLARGPAPPGP